MSVPRYADGSEAKAGDQVVYAGKASPSYKARVGTVVRVNIHRISVRWPIDSPYRRDMLCHYADGKLALHKRAEACEASSGHEEVSPDLRSVTLTTQEARLVGGIIANWIGEMGSIFNRVEMRSEENALRRKFGLEEQK